MVETPPPTIDPAGGLPRYAEGGKKKEKRRPKDCTATLVSYSIDLIGENFGRWLGHGRQRSSQCDNAISSFKIIDIS